MMGKNLALLAVAVLGGALAVFLVMKMIPSHIADSAPSAANVAGFTRDCVDGVLAERKPPAGCLSAQAIQEAYGVDVEALLESERAAMIMTARRIARGELTDEKDYKACLKDGLCRPVPILTAKEKEALEDAEVLRKRALFWHLVNDGSLTPEICASLTLCRAMTALGLMEDQNVSAR